MLEKKVYSPLLRVFQLTSEKKNVHNLRKRGYTDQYTHTGSKGRLHDGTPVNISKISFTKASGSTVYSSVFMEGSSGNIIVSTFRLCRIIRSNAEGPASNT